MKNLLFCATLSLPFLAWAQPDNDFCSDALDISEILMGDIGEQISLGPFVNLEATGEPELADDLAGFWFDIAPGASSPAVDQSVWFKFTGDGNTYQIFTWSCPGSAFYSNDLQLALYAGSCDNLSLVTANDDMQVWWGWWHSVLNFTAEEGIEYWLMADGFNHYDGDEWQGVGQGTFCLAGMQLEPLTDHITCDASRNISALFEETTASSPGFIGPFDDTELGSGIGMNLEADMLGTECWNDGVDDGSVWFSWTGDGNSYTVSHSQCQEDLTETWLYYFSWDSQMALYRGDCAELVPIACSEDLNFDENQFWSQIGFDSEEGEEYHLRFDGFHWTAAGFEWSAEGAFCLRADAGSVNNAPDQTETFVIDAYPNPARNQITISWSGDEATADIRVINPAGKEAAFWPSVRRGSEHTFDLPSGFYTLQIETSKTRSTRHLQILR